MTIDYEASKVALMRGIADFNLNLVTVQEWSDSVVDAALGDTVVYEKLRHPGVRMCGHHDDYVQVYPERTDDE